MSTVVIRVARPSVGEEEAAAITQVLLSGNYVSGKKVEEFERAFAEYIGGNHAVAVNSGTAALHTALAVLGIGPGDEVIVPPLTFFSTISAVLHQNAIPIFADIDPDSFCLDPRDVEEKITERTRAIMPVHLYGNSAEIDALVNIAGRHDLKVIEDAAQAHGTEYKGKKVGSMSDIGCFSFFATKHMTTGEGGMLVTNNGKWTELAMMIRNHGLSNRDDHDCLGYNYRMNEIAAAIGIVQLRKLDSMNQRRIDNSLYLIEELEERRIPWLAVPKLKEHIKHTFFWCPVCIDEEKAGFSTKELIVKLREKGIETRNRYQEPLYKQKILIEKNPYPRGFPFNSKHYSQELDYGKVNLKNAEKVAGRIVGLPNHCGLGRSELDYIVDVLSNIA